MTRHAFGAAVAAAVLSLAAVPAAFAQAPAAQVPPIVYKERTLPNGMKVFTSLDRTTPNVTVQVWYGVGSKDDPRGRSGFAHLFEHLMFKATRDMPAETMDRLTEDVGGFNNAFTADDTTAYYEVIPANHLQRLLWAESERMGSLVVDEANFKSERAVVEEELRQRVLADPYGRFFRFAIPQASYAVHPYKRPGIGSIDELEASTLDDVLAFHQTYYRPDNAALFIVGNFDEAQLNGWVDRYFGALKPPAKSIPRVMAVEPERTGPKTVTAFGPNVPLPAVAITWLVPGAPAKDTAALTVLDAILSSGKSSRLYNSLVYDQQIAQTAFSSDDQNNQAGLFYVGAVMAGGKTVEQGEASLHAEVAKLRAAPPSEAELAEAKNELVASAVRERETIDGRANALGQALVIEGDAARANTDIAAIQAVTASDIQRVARTYLRDDRAVTIRYLDEGEKKAGQADVAKPVVTKAASTKYTGPILALADAAHRKAPPEIGKPVEPVLPTPAEKTLPNGLRVIVARSSDLPLVTAELTVRSGAAADPQGLAGTASMAADLLTEGTTTRSAVDIARETEALGANLTAGSGWESSTVGLNVMPQNLAPAMAIMADVARNPVFKSEELERVRKESLDALSVAYQRPGSVAGFAAAPLIYQGSPFGHVAAGTPTSLTKISRDALVGMHDAYWRPDNAILVITGDLTPEEGFALAEKNFGDWARPAAPLPPAPTADMTPKPHAVVIDMPESGQAGVVVAKTAIVRSDPRYYAGLVANTVLGGGYSARLNEEIRIKRGLSYGANSSLTARQSTGAFTASAQTKPQSAPEVVTLVRQEMAKLGQTPPTADELTARKSVLVGDYGRDIATTDGLAGILSDLALYGIDLGEMKVYTAKVEAVTPEQVRDFSSSVLDPTNATVVVAGDAKLFASEMPKVLPNAETIPLDQLDLDSPTLRKAP
ncbi:MAG: M16 family metallopeptidase [Parcubacteria group bacterium]